MGPNSSGKSTIIQSILLLRQTVDSRDIENPLSINGSYLNLGSYTDLIYMHNRENQLVIEFSFDAILSYVGDKSKETKSTGPVVVRAQFSYNSKTRQIHLQKTNVKKGESEFTVQRVNGSKYKSIVTTDKGPEEFFVRPYKFYGGLVIRPKVSKQAKSKEKRIPSIEPSFLLSRFSFEIERFLDSFFYVGPLRDSPKRIYVATGETPQDVGLRGEGSVDVLWMASRHKATKKLLTSVNHWLKAFELAEKAELKPMGSNSYALNFIMPETKLEVNLADVGFGASQVLPVIIEGYFSRENSTLLIEQPEIHLHPKAQAVLADLLIDIAKSKTIIVETHSEHLISRIQRRIAEGTIKRDDVALYYCQSSKEGGVVKRVEFDENGRFVGEGLPEGFFEVGFVETWEHLKAITKPKE